MGEISARVVTKPCDNTRSQSQMFNRSLCGVAKWGLAVSFFVHCNTAFSQLRNGEYSALCLRSYTSSVFLSLSCSTTREKNPSFY